MHKPNLSVRIDLNFCIYCLKFYKQIQFIHKLLQIQSALQIKQYNRYGKNLNKNTEMEF